MTLVFRITLDDALAHAVARRLAPALDQQASNKAVRRTLAPALRAVCEAQVKAWIGTVPKDPR